ncbi:hypothetical protein J6590_015449 [Homalodisca vitripennis]|nr:hypothetical protein J6590_015449 [Homalodisca vitripennis]
MLICWFASTGWAPIQGTYSSKMLEWVELALFGVAVTFLEPNVTKEEIASAGCKCFIALNGAGEDKNLLNLRNDFPSRLLRVQNSSLIVDSKPMKQRPNTPKEHTRSGWGSRKSTPTGVGQRTSKG